VTGWFDALPLHRKLITMALAVSTAALSAALIGLVAFDVLRFRQSAADDALALAQVIAENAAATIVFNDAQNARQMLDSVQVRPFISRACLYRAGGSLLAGFERPGSAPCPVVPADARTWRAVASRVAVARNGRVVGSIFVERRLDDLPGRVIATASAGLFMLLVAGVVAFGVARRLQATISRPIVSLANAARAIGRDQHAPMPTIEAPPDETGALVDAFSEMVRRLLSSNEALTMEVEERRRMQAEREALLVREREANRLKDEFLAAVSHELRTPLNAIMGWTQVLANMKPEDRGGPTLAKAIASLSRNAHAQSRVIEDLLDVSRIVTGKLQLKVAAVDLRAVIESALDVVAPIAAAKRVRLDVDLPPAASMIRGDVDRVRQVLWNLLSNAVKFTPPDGTVSVRVSGDAAHYTLVVSDSGIGIAPAFLPHVFERFRQADGSTTREHGGLGLGLALVKELTELHGGTVRADSPGVGHGATFTVTLPGLARTSAGQPFAPAPQIAAPRLDGVEILAVDDSPDALDVIAAALGDAGATVRIASSGSEAMAQVRRSLPHVILCDIAMPGMDGFALLDAIRQDARAKAIPVLAVTAYASEDSRETCARAGFQGYISKPFAIAELVRDVAAALSRT